MSVSFGISAEDKLKAPLIVKKKQLFTQELLHKTISGDFSKDFASILSQINHCWLSEVSGCVSQQYYVKLHVDRKKKSTHLLLALLFRKCVPNTWFRRYTLCDVIEGTDPRLLTGHLPSETPLCPLPNKYVASHRIYYLCKAK